METIKLGDSAADIITGFEGVVVARTQWLMGCDRLTLQPRVVVEGKIPPTETFDVGQLKRTGKGPLEPTVVTSRDRGGPRPEPVKR